MTTKYKSRKIKFKTTFRQKAIIMKTLPRKEKKMWKTKQNITFIVCKSQNNKQLQYLK